MSLAGAVRWTLSSRIFTSMVSVGAPGMANSTTSLWFSLSAYATVLGATLIRSSGILAPSFYNPGFPFCLPGHQPVYSQSPPTRGRPWNDHLGAFAGVALGVAGRKYRPGPRF